MTTLTRKVVPDRASEMPTPQENEQAPNDAEPR